MSSRVLPLAGLLALLLTSPGQAEVPRVAADIPPVRSLVARVMSGLGDPEPIIRAGASPHGYALRPSEAGALQSAEAVFWVGPALTPWLEETIGTLAPDARSVPLLEAPGTEPVARRASARFAPHDHGDHSKTEEHHPHQDAHAEPAHDDHAGDHDHGPDATDPHAWLDPWTGKAWLDAIAATLSDLDPENADTYARNAAEGRAEIDAAAERAAEILAPVSDLRFVVFHDAYRYFERAFDLSAAGAIALSDASDPSPARIAEIRDTVRELGVTCVLAEPQFDAGLVNTVADAAEIRTGVIDPLGAEIEPGPDLYPDLIVEVARRIAACGD